MPPTLRMLNDGFRSPAFNMAADLFLLHNCSHDNQVTLRFYQWNPPCISLGCMQKADDDLDILAIRNAGMSWVKRPTGGRAVLHQGDCTYSITFSRRNQAMGSSIGQTYRLICLCLMRGLERAGIAGESHDSKLDIKEARTSIKLPCFLAPNRDEIMINGQKLVGSAQKRTSHAVLQHGSIPITDDSLRLPDYLRMSEEERVVQWSLLRQKSTFVNAHVPRMTYSELSQCLKEGFVEGLEFDAEESGWREEELQGIDTQKKQIEQ